MAQDKPEPENSPMSTPISSQSSQSSSFGLYSFSQEAGIPAMSAEETNVIETELSEIQNLSPQQIQARIEAFEKQSRELYLKTRTARKEMHARLAGLSEEELSKMNLKGVYIPRRSKDGKPKMSKEAKQFKEAKSTAGKLGIGAADFAALISKLKSGK